MAFIRLDTISSCGLQMGQVLGSSLEDYALLPEKTGQFADRVKTGNLGQNQGPMQKIFFFTQAYFASSLMAKHIFCRNISSVAPP